MNTLLTIEQTAEYLGVSKLTIYDWVSQRRIEYVKVGRLLRFKREQLDRWIDKHTIKARGAHGTNKA
ncbi:MAG: hypothetical protein A4E19_17965 [Nitrospira sp. SG-bin1]|nr:MAG: hypothetical protein A4E19_17965 [Nitrospira sp. SG-bin1]